MLHFQSIRSVVHSCAKSIRGSTRNYERIYRVLELESLEDRVMLSSVTLQQNDVVEIIGSVAADQIHVRDIGRFVQATIVTEGVRTVKKLDVRNPAKIVVYGMRGDDVIVNKTAAPMEAFGGKGNDKILGNIGDDFLNGDDGKDVINGYGGKDTIKGGRGDDWLSGGKDDDIIEGGEQKDRIYGSGGDDKLSGNDGNDLIHGGNGNDRINGDLGADQIYGENGHDELHGDQGCFDCVSTGQFIFVGDADRIFGGNGNDKLFGNGGDDIIFGQAGDDEVGGHDGDDQIFGNTGRDLLYGGGGDNIIRAGSGDDSVIAGSGDDIVLGEQGDDHIQGGFGNDKLRGGTGNDKISGGFGNDSVFGDGGSDALDGGDGNDSLYGGLLSDKKDGGDTINGGAGNDLLIGYYGNDLLFGDAGRDRLLGSFGDDYLEGGDDGDFLFGQAGRDFLLGGSGNDELDGGTQNDRLFGGPGNDELQGNEGSDQLEGEAGNDILLGDRVSDRRGGRDILRGGTGNDLLQGSYGHDRLYGEAGGDNLKGEQGNDFLQDNIGPENRLDGGPGINDIQFLFEPGDLHATIRNGGKVLELTGTDEAYPDTGFTLLTTGQNRWKLLRSGAQFIYKADGRILLDLDDNKLASVNRDLTLTTFGFELETFNARTAEESVINPDSLDIDTNGGGLRNFLQSIKKTTGLGITLPSISYGISSGQDLMDIDAALPLRASQPYLHFTVDSGFGLSFGSARLTVPTAEGIKSFSIIVDPTDLFFFAKGNFDFKTSDLEVGVGYSQKGRIPFRPNAELDDYNGMLFGNLFIELNGVPLPNGFSVDGSLVLDLDANDDGRMLINPSTQLGQLAPGGRFYNRLLDAAHDVKVGVNGTLNFGKQFKQKVKSEFLKKLFDEIKVNAEVRIAEGTIVYDGLLGEIHLKGQTVNPFEGTPLEKLEFLAGRKELSGSVKNLGADPRFKLDYYGMNGTSIASRTDEFHLNNQGATFRGESQVLGQSIVMTGGIKFDGTIFLRGTASVGSNMFSEETGGASAGLYFDVQGTASLSDVQLTVTARLDVWANAITYGLFDLKTGFAADLHLTGRVDLGLASTSAAFTAKADFALYVVGVRIGVDASFGLTVSPNRFSFDAGPHRVEVTW